MILTCPECATRYFVGDDQVGSDGRTVKCSACGNRWTARRDAPLELSIDAETGAMAREPEPLAPEPAPLVELPGEELPKVFRAKAVNERKTREAATLGIVWAGTLGALVLVVGGAVVMRQSVTEVWPRTATAFAAIGFPVNRSGLQIEDVKAEPALQDGHAALSVTGILRNVKGEAVVAPPLQIRLVNRDGKPVMAKIVQAADPRIPAGETRHFAVVLIDPPRTASVVEFTFVYDKGGEVQKPMSGAPKAKAEVKLRGPGEAHPPEAPPPEAVPEAAPVAEPAHPEPAH